MKEQRIVVADDHPLTRSGLVTVLSAIDAITVVGEAADGSEAIEKVESLKPDIIIMDITMPILDGIAATKRIAKDFPETKVVILSMHEEAVFALNSFKAGASAYVLKGAVTEEIVKAVETVATGKRYVCQVMASELLSDFVDIIQKDIPKDPIDSLTAREKEVLKLIAAGSTNKDIANKLCISLATVKTHRVNLMGKLDVHDVAALVKLAVSKGIA